MTTVELKPHFQLRYSSFPLSLPERKSQSPSTIISLTDSYHSILSFCYAQEEPIHHVSDTCSIVTSHDESPLLSNPLLTAFYTGRDSDQHNTYKMNRPSVNICLFMSGLSVKPAPVSFYRTENNEVITKDVVYNFFPWLSVK